MKIWKLEYSNKNEKKCQKIDSPFLFQSLSVICEIQPPPQPHLTSFQK